MHQVSRRGWLAATATALTGGAGCLGLGGSDDPVTVGSLLPLSGEGTLATFASHHQRAIDAAVAHVNAAGGVHGRTVVHESADTAADPATAADAYQSLVDDGAVAIVGAVLSSVTASLADRPAEDGVLMLSPSSTSPSLASAGRTDDAKFFGRTCPNDRQQAAAMAKILDDARYADADDATILYVDDAFGSALVDGVESATDTTVRATVPFAPSDPSPVTRVDAATTGDPDAVVFVGTPGPSASVLDELVAADYDGDVVVSAGMSVDAGDDDYAGVYTPSVASARTVGTQRLQRELSDLQPLMAYTTNAYDAAMLAALAGERADDVSSTAIAQSLRAVAGGTGHSVSVGQFDRASALFDAGREVNYRGASGGVDLQPNLEPLSSYLIERVQSGSVRTLELLQRSYFGGDGE
jgi:ABC-type branched-subunit amino acid transport system substrate-binding protein